jgi:hypothetical protein
MVGGRNGTVTAGSSAVMNSVFRFTTRRAVNCAASYVQADPANCAATCSSDTDMSKSPKGALSMTVWRVPSSDGAKCISGLTANLGNPVSKLWEAAGEQGQNCDCPYCLTAPGGAGETALPKSLADTMVNTTYVSTYTLVSANSGTVPLYCIAGYGKSADFTCATQTSTVYSGKYAAYPTCDPLPCSTKPPTDKVDHIHLPMTDCQDVASNNTLAHNGNCTMECERGYAPESGRQFQCRYGAYSGSSPAGTLDKKHVLPKCVKQVCKNKPTIDNGNLDCDEVGDTLGTKCELSCNPGYKKTGPDSVTCAVKDTDGPETEPVFSDPGTCEPLECADIVLKDAHMSLVSTTGSQPADTAKVKCEEGYNLKPTDGVFTCSSAKAGADPEWTGDATCEAVKCAAGSFDNGELVADGDGDYEFGDTGTLKCDSGFALEGSSTYTCEASGEMVGTGSCAESKCAEPTLGTGMASTSCSGAQGEGATCSITCEDGYTGQGEFKCSGGSYVKKGVCLKSGSGAKVTVKTYVQGTITLTIVPPEGMTGEELAADPEFSASVAASLADALPGVDMDQITIISITIVSARRLQKGDGRELQASKLKVDYKVEVEDEAAAEKIKNEITTNKAAFQESFTKALEEKADVVVEAIEVSDPVVAEEYVVEEPAAAAAKEEEDGGGGGALIGGIVGGVGGVALLGFCFYMYSKKQQSQE